MHLYNEKVYSFSLSYTIYIYSIIFQIIIIYENKLKALFLLVKKHNLYFYIWCISTTFFKSFIIIHKFICSFE